MGTPQRIQRKRTPGWKAPEGVVNVTRPGKYGNPYYPGCGLGFGNVVGSLPQRWPLITKADMVRHFRESMRLQALYEPKEHAEFLAPLRGKTLMCWCKPTDPCHADVLLELANADPT